MILVFILRQKAKPALQHRDSLHQQQQTVQHALDGSDKHNHHILRTKLPSDAEHRMGVYLSDSATAAGFGQFAAI